MLDLKNKMIILKSKPGGIISKIIKVIDNGENHKNY